MKLTSFILILFLAFNSISAQNCCEIKLNKENSLKHLGKEFQRLRNLKDRDCCNKYGSGMMKIMEMLNNRLDIGVSEKTIIKIMGKPDKYVSKKNPIDVIAFKEEERILIYYWRGMHDFLYFGIKNNKLFYKNWYYALE